MATEETNHIHTAAGEGFTLNEIHGQSVCQHNGENGTIVVESGIYPQPGDAGTSNVGTANEVQPFNGKQNILEHETIDELSDKEIYDDVAHEVTSFTISDKATLDIVIGDSYKFNVTPNPITANLPNLVWDCTQDEDEETGKKFDVCYVNDGVLRTLNVGTSTVTAYDITNPENIKSATITVNVVKVLPTSPAGE